MKEPTSKNLLLFKKKVWSYYKKHKRPMPWRDNTSPYYVVMSEIMLQQTQVSRVTEKFPSFITQFPDWKALAQASTKEVLREWSGLGYNRRALFLKRIAETITDNGKIKGSLPSTYQELTQLPGIGPNTAGSILAFAFNIPHPFIETNIRSVFIHEFFSEIEKQEGKRACKKIDDVELMPLIGKALDLKNPREWYYALMDYGSFLKKQLPNPSRKSAHHAKQTPFKGSNRELRSAILRLILKQPMTQDSIIQKFPTKQKSAVLRNIEALVTEGFIKKRGARYCP